MKQQHDIPKCLEDIRTAIDDIEQYLTRFMGDHRRLLKAEVERLLG